MDVQPANVNQLRLANDGRWVEIDKDIGGVVDDLKRIDPNLGVRFAENGNPPFWAVFVMEDEGRTTRLVLTQQAYQTAAGTWSGLDQRVVDRIMRIGHSSYDFAGELEKANRAAKRDQKRVQNERLSEAGERVAHALRKDLGSKRQAFVPRSV